MGKLRMTVYRFYFLDKDRRVSGPPEVGTFDDDAAAIADARRQVEDETIEVWDGARRVAVLHPEKRN
jgi:hypothetical protein